METLENVVSEMEQVVKTSFMGDSAINFWALMQNVEKADANKKDLRVFARRQTSMTYKVRKIEKLRLEMEALQKEVDDYMYVYNLTEFPVCDPALIPEKKPRGRPRKVKEITEVTGAITGVVETKTRGRKKKAEVVEVVVAANSYQIADSFFDNLNAVASTEVTGEVITEVAKTNVVTVKATTEVIPGANVVDLKGLGVNSFMSTKKHININPPFPNSPRI